MGLGPGLDRHGRHPLGILGVLGDGHVHLLEAELLSSTIAACSEVPWETRVEEAATCAAAELTEPAALRISPIVTWSF